MTAHLPTYASAAARCRVIATTLTTPRAGLRVVLLASAATLGACQSPHAEAQKPRAETRLETAKQRFSYSVGAKLGRDLVKGEHDVEYKLLLRGIEDAVSGKPLLSEEEGTDAIESHLKQQREQQEAQRVERAKRAEAEAQTFLAQNRKRPGVIELASGLQYEILRAGNGPSPSASDFVTCHYQGALLDGTVFDDTRKKAAPRTFVVSSVVAGFEEALQRMQPGALWKLYLPPKLAYGRSGFAQSIPPNAALVFEVELLAAGPRRGG